MVRENKVSNSFFIKPDIFLLIISKFAVKIFCCNIFGRTQFCLSSIKRKLSFFGKTLTKEICKDILYVI